MSNKMTARMMQGRQLRWLCCSSECLRRCCFGTLCFETEAATDMDSDCGTAVAKCIGRQIKCKDHSLPGLWIHCVIIVQCFITPASKADSVWHPLPSPQILSLRSSSEIMSLWGDQIGLVFASLNLVRFHARIGVAGELQKQG